MSLLDKAQRTTGTILIGIALFMEVFAEIIKPIDYIGIFVPYASQIFIIGLFIIFYSFLKNYKPVLWITYFAFAIFVFWFYFIR